MAEKYLYTEDFLDLFYVASAGQDKTFVKVVEEVVEDTPIAANVVEVVRCKDCKYHHWEKEPEHGKTIHFCSVLNAEVFKDFYCYHGTPKERGADK